MACVTGLAGGFGLALSAGGAGTLERPVTVAGLACPLVAEPVAADTSVPGARVAPAPCPELEFAVECELDPIA